MAEAACAGSVRVLVWLIVRYNSNKKCWFTLCSFSIGRLSELAPATDEVSTTRLTLSFDFTTDPSTFCTSTQNRISAMSFTQPHAAAT